MPRALWLMLMLLPQLAQAQLPEALRSPGRKSDSAGVTASNWGISPAGRLFELGEVPQGLAFSPDQSILAIANCGQGVQSVQLIETASLKTVATVPIKAPQAIFHGLAFSPDGSQLYVSGGPTDRIKVIEVATAATATPRDLTLRTKPVEPIIQNPEDFAGKVTLPDPGGKGVYLYPIGLAVAPDGAIWAAETLGSAIARVDPATGQVTHRIAVGPYPYELAFSTDGQRAFVTLWGAAKVALVDVAAGRVTSTIDVGKHPAGLHLDRLRQRLYVANAHSDSVSIIDCVAGTLLGTVPLHPYQDAPPGTMPNALAVSPDGGTLYVADAGNNCLDVVALNGPLTGGRVLGRIPTGWFPTGVEVARDGSIWVISAKGLGSGQNAYPKREYVARFLDGLGQVIARPTRAELARYDEQVRANNYTASGAEARGERAASSPIPARVGEKSPIEHVVYVIKENRTYDQVFGDCPQGNGDPKLCLFGRQVTPNQHRLAEQYVLLDNFYCDGSVSVDGHQWAKAAGVSDAVEKGWPLQYSQRGPGLGGPVGAPASPWLWERAAQMGVSSKQFASGIVPGMDLKAVENVLEQVRTWEAEKALPRLIVMHLPNNHTLGTQKNKPTPKAMVAENDLAVGRLIAGLSRTPSWSKMCVFIVEDDAQDGPDHVDCHRSPALVIGPYVKRGVVDSHFYDQVAVLRTIGLILGLPPLSQFDAAAVPMFTLFQDEPICTAYDAIEPEQRLDEMNALGAYGQEQCMAMNFEEVDVAPWPEFNRILWHSIMGEDMPYPEIQHTRHRLAVKPDEDDD
ncbi:MAG: bifunctional YncE family protein/alkaline phosphatase family protein [Armatimonadetes bacterium]|nr:bifunctional YncE family protein/alkaline phosphatase family protein [Armatimonadota bacterium]